SPIWICGTRERIVLPEEPRLYWMSAAVKIVMSAASAGTAVVLLIAADDIVEFVRTARQAAVCAATSNFALWSTRRYGRGGLGPRRQDQCMESRRRTPLRVDRARSSRQGGFAYAARPPGRKGAHWKQQRSSNNASLSWMFFSPTSSCRAY